MGNANILKVRWLANWASQTAWFFSFDLKLFIDFSLSLKLFIVEISICSISVYRDHWLLLLFIEHETFESIFCSRYWWSNLVFTIKRKSNVKSTSNAWISFNDSLQNIFPVHSFMDSWTLIFIIIWHWFAWWQTYCLARGFSYI